MWPRRRTTSACEELDRKHDAGTTVVIEEECKPSLDAGSSSILSDEIVVEEHAEDSATADLPAEPVKMYTVVISKWSRRSQCSLTVPPSQLQSCASCLRLGKCFTTTTTHQN
jgi:hypothetical protein